MDAGTGDGGIEKDSGAKKDAGKFMPRDAGSSMTMTMSPPVQCGSKMCQAPAGLGGLIGGLGGAIPGGASGLTGLLPTPVACCLDDGSCGMAGMAGAMCESPATRDMRCPSIDLGALQMFAGNMGFGCCTASGKCGVDGAAFGRGCVENGEAASMLGPLSGFIMPPAPKACSGGDEDGGTIDAGR